MPIDISELNGDPDFAQTISILRALAPTFANEGIATAAYADAVPLVATVQPATEADLKALPEGTNLTDVISVWSGDEIQVGDQTGAGSDILIVNGKSYRVVKREDRVKNGYRRVFAERFTP
jgi:hypothetical protein